jgi:hypothetical protein
LEDNDKADIISKAGFFVVGKILYPRFPQFFSIVALVSNCCGDEGAASVIR